jgi:hypothetical protein
MWIGSAKSTIFNVERFTTVPCTGIKKKTIHKKFQDFIPLRICLCAAVRQYENAQNYMF